VELLTHPKYRPDIDGLRGVAVLLVIGFHAFPGRIPGGFIGVDVFFVISGFLISSIIFRSLENDRFSYADFYGRRIRRIFPALTLVLVACLIYGWFQIPSEYKLIGKHVAAGAGFVSNFASWRDTGYFDSSASQKPLLHLWSLGIEEQFYIFWPAILGFVWMRKYNSFLKITLSILCCSFLVNIWTVRSHPVAAFYSPLSRFWELMLGGVLAYLTLHRPDFLVKSTNGQAAIGLLMIVPPALFLTNQSVFPGWWALLPTVGAFLVLSAGPASWLNRNLFGNPLLVSVGLISYPLYLWHWPLLYAFSQLPSQEYLTHAQSVFGRMFVIAVSVLLSWLTYRMVEVPIRSGSPRRNLTYFLVGSLALVAFVGGLAYKTDGFVSRLSPLLAQILSYDYVQNYSVGYRVDTCLIDPSIGQTSFGDCTSYPSVRAVSDVLVWGDSHAAQLYPGIQTAIGSNSKITQFTVSSCPPIIESTPEIDPHCNEINSHVMEWVAKDRPDRVILGGFWPDYNWEQLEHTVKGLKLLDVKRIDLVGPVPVWEHDLPTELLLYSRADKSRSALPHRMSYGLDGGIAALNASMREFAKQVGINYFSPYDILCNDAGCLTMVGDTPDTLTAWDKAHLTIAASRYVVARFAK
jgi:peptidoglycan/LPS O-acetylase OafA/YrhL